jgi:hypothetical protein
MVFRRVFGIQMPWVGESDVDVGTVALIHECINLGVIVSQVIFKVEELVYILKEWTDKECRTVGIHTLARKTIPTVIDRLENGINVIRSVEGQMPNSRFISRDYGITHEGMRHPNPEINTDFDVHDRKLSNTLQLLVNGFEMVVLIMNILEDVVVNPTTGFENEDETNVSENSFWAEVGRAQSQALMRHVDGHMPSGEEIKENWDEDKQSVLNCIDAITKFIRKYQTPVTLDAEGVGDVSVLLLRLEMMKESVDNYSVYNGLH